MQQARIGHTRIREIQIESRVTRECSGHVFQLSGVEWEVVMLVV